MEILRVLLILVEVVASLLLVGVILLQRSKSEGMGGLAMGGGMGEQLFGSRTGNVLTRTTIILACVFLGTTTLLAVVYSRGGQTQSIIEKRGGSLPALPPAGPGPVSSAPMQAAPAAAPSAPVETPAAAPASAAPAAPVTVTIPPVAAPAAAPAPGK